MNITEEELKDLREARNGQEWNKLVDKIKAKRNGAFPPDWYSKVILGDINPNIDLSITVENVSWTDDIISAFC